MISTFNDDPYSLEFLAWVSWQLEIVICCLGTQLENPLFSTSSGIVGSRLFSVSGFDPNCCYRLCGLCQCVCVCVCVCNHVCTLGFRLHHHCAQAMLGVLSTMLPLPRCSSFQNLFVNCVSWLSQFQFAIYFDRRCLRGDGCIDPMYGQIVSKKLCPEPLWLIDPICHFF
jgi:hypothetical protein